MRELNLPPGLLDAVARLIRQHPGGISEFELMQQLDKHYPELYPKPDLRDPLLLFQHHFVLMHVLYRLQDEWYQAGEGVLDINALRIQLRPLKEGGGQHLSVDASLKDYYLDWSNLSRENPESVQSLLDGFWKRLLGERKSPEALRQLGLDEKADLAKIKSRYRRLASEHHPDKGGDPEEFRRIREAYEALVAGRG